MAQVLLFTGALVFFALGVAHGALTLRDVSSPRALTPTDNNVRLAMQGSQLVFDRRLNLWRAWLGFNLSHSLGLVLFGGGLIAVACLHFPFYAQSPILQLTAVATAAAYLILSMRFWFVGPVIGSGFGLVCFLASASLLQLA